MNIIHPNKAVVHPNAKILSWFTLDPNLYEFLLLSTKEDILKSVGKKKHLLVAIDFHCIDSSNKSMATGNSLVTNNLQNILFCVEQKKETHTGLEQV